MRFRRSSAGFTLLEIVVVILLIVTITGVFVSKFTSVFGWKIKSDIRKFVDTWEFLYSEAAARGESYRLIINIEGNSYYVRREVRPLPNEQVVKQVDYLANLRTQSEQERREQEEEDDLPSLEDEYKMEEARQSGDLPSLFYSYVFADSAQDSRLATPIEFPSLAKNVEFTTGLNVRNVKTLRGNADSGKSFIRFSPKGAAEFAAVYLEMEEEIYTVMMNPSTGSVSFKTGEIDFNWTGGKQNASNFQ